MYFLRKLKTNTKSFRLFLIIGITLIVYLLALTLYGGQAAMVVWGLIMLIYVPGTVIDLKITRNPVFLVPLFFQLSAGGLACILAFNHPKSVRSLVILLGLAILFFMIWSLILTSTRKIKWRHRDVLELAAMPVKDVSNGFTSRPRPTGKADFSEVELKGFTRFLRYHLIAIPHLEENRIVFSLDMTFKHKAGLLKNYLMHSYVAFDFDGNVSAFISKNDYLKYQNQLSFDQLCQSMGNLFIDFLELFKKGEGIRVIDRMNALRLNPFEDFVDS